MFSRYLLLLMITSFLSCSEYEIQKIQEEQHAGVTAPDIMLGSDSFDFGENDARYDISTTVVDIYNEGNDTLIISGVSGDAGITVFEYQVVDLSIEPGEKGELRISYDPITMGEDLEELNIYSNDPDENPVTINLAGTGISPIIRVSPTNWSFDSTYVGCNESIFVTVENAGNASLSVTSITGFASLPPNFNFDIHGGTNPTLPWSLEPGEKINFEVIYTPEDIGFDEAFLEIESDDPASPIVVISQEGDGSYEKIVKDEFDQDETSGVDILFIIDNSGSMGSFQSSLSSNFNSFMSTFITRGIDYQIGFITTDSSELIDGVVIDNTLPDPLGSSTNIIDSIGTRGSSTERGLLMSYECLASPVKCGVGSAFLRSDMRVILIYVSDEDDHSAGFTSLDMLAHLDSIKPSPTLFKAHSVVGPSDGSCWSADPGLTYIDVSSLTFGTTLSICDADWGTTMESLAVESILMTSFMLAEVPIEETIEAKVNGVTVSAWYFDNATNTVIFTSPPPEGSHIEVEYAIASCQ